MVESFPSVDATTNQLPLSVRTAIAANLADGATPEGSALTAAFVAGNPTLIVAYNDDGTVASVTENDVLTSFTYNVDGSVDTQTRAGVTKTFEYDGNGNLIGAI